MQLTNSNQNNCLEIKNYDFYLSKVQKLQKRVSDVLDQLKKPLNYILPPNFQQKFAECKQQPHYDNEWIEKYKDIISYMIEGQINVTLMGLTKKFKQQIGGQTTFWLDLICDIAQNQKYQESLRIWQINDSYKSCLPLPIEQYEKIRKFRKLAKSDITVTKNLLNCIHQLKNSIENPNVSKKKPEDLMLKLKNLQQKFEQSDRKLISFLKDYHQLISNVQFFHQSVHFYGSVQTSIDNFKKTQKVQSSDSHNKKPKKDKKQNKGLKQTHITVYSSVPYKQNTQNLLLNKIAGVQKPQLTNEQKQNFHKLLNSMSEPIESITQLRQNFKAQALKDKTPLFHRPSSYFSSIFGLQFDYFNYENYFISLQMSSQFSLTNPYEQKYFINYITSSIEFYQQLLGQEIGSDDQDYDDSSQEDYQQQSLNQQEINQIFNFDDAYEMSDDEREMHRQAISIEKRFNGNQWIYNFKRPEQIQIQQKNTNNQRIKVSYISSAQFLQNTMILCPCSLPMYNTYQAQNDYQIKEYQLPKLKQLINNKSRKQILDQYNENQELQNQFSKNKLNFILSKRVKKIVIRDKLSNKQMTKYQLKQNQNQQQEKQQNNSKKLSNRFQEDDTIFEEEQDHEKQQQSNRKLKDQEFTLRRSRKSQQSQKSKAVTQNITNKPLQQFGQYLTENDRNPKSQHFNNNMDFSNTLTLRNLRERKSRVNYNEKSLADKALNQYKNRLSVKDFEI